MINNANDRMVLALEKIANRLDSLVTLIEKEEFYVKGDMHTFGD